MALTLSREELADLVETIMTVREKGTGRKLTEEEHCTLVAKFSRSINHPGGSDLIYYPELIGGYPKGREPTVDEIVDMAIREI